MRMELVQAIICTTVIAFAFATISRAQMGLGGVNGFPMTLPLQRVFPLDTQVDLSQLISRDRTRYDQLTQKGVVEFPLHGLTDNQRLYSTKVRLGTPAQEFSVFIDTGSDVLWVSCSNCSNCPLSSSFSDVNYYPAFNTSRSTTASTISCSDNKCKREESQCNKWNNHCSYNIRYYDGSGASGYYVNDVFHLNGSSHKIVFGCSTSQLSQHIMQMDGHIMQMDGILGLGRKSMSVISQLSIQVFSHCLTGDLEGGFLVLGEIMDPNMVYTPLRPTLSNYIVDMESISVGNQTLDIGSSGSETLIDSGTTLTYFEDSVYALFVKAITQAVNRTAAPYPSMEGVQCYEIQSSADDVFPKVRLNFKGGAYMVIYPRDFLSLEDLDGDLNNIWCVRIQRTTDRAINILGDLVLKHKAVVYDVAHQRIGWVNYNCSKAINSSVINTSQQSGCSSLRTSPVLRVWILIIILIRALFF